MTCRVFLLLIVAVLLSSPAHGQQPRVIVTSDGEIDDECSMVRFLLYANEWDIEGIVTSSSQYHWRGHRRAGDDWMGPYLDAYEQIHPNLVQHDGRYPTPEYLRARTVLGNVDAEGEMDAVTPGSQLIVEVLLDESDHRPVWLQAWGGTNTIARALKTIEEEHPEKMAYVADKLRFFFIWEQDSTYQAYIRPHWGKYDIPTIISDQLVGQPRGDHVRTRKGTFEVVGGRFKVGEQGPQRRIGLPGQLQIDVRLGAVALPPLFVHAQRSERDVMPARRQVEIPAVQGVFDRQRQGQLPGPATQARIVCSLEAPEPLIGDERGVHLLGKPLELAAIELPDQFHGRQQRFAPRFAGKLQLPTHCATCAGPRS